MARLICPWLFCWSMAAPHVALFPARPWNPMLAIVPVLLLRIGLTRACAGLSHGASQDRHGVMWSMPDEGNGPVECQVGRGGENPA
jgi:hypothetical protein